MAVYSRRRLIQSLGAAGTVLVAGCNESDTDPEITTDNPTTTNIPAVEEPVAVAASDVAWHLETHRRLPDTYKLDGRAIDEAELVTELLKRIDELADKDVAPNSEFSAPDERYPSLGKAIFTSSAEPSVMYGETLSKGTYLRILKALSNRSTLPAKLLFDGSMLRFVDLVYLLAVLVRNAAFYDSLPRSVEVKLISTVGLTPGGGDDTDYEKSCLETPAEHAVYTSPVFRHPSGHLHFQGGYYGLRSADFDLFRKTLRVAKSTRPSLVVNQVDEWVTEQWNQGIYPSYSDERLKPSAAEHARYFAFKSGHPGIVKTAMLRSVGIPTKLYFSAEEEVGQVWNPMPFVGGKWQKVPTHDWLERSKKIDKIFDPADRARPERADTLIRNIRKILRYDASDSVQRTIWLNPSDVAERSVERLRASLKRADANRVILSVKTESGSLHYPSERFDDIVEYDALSELSSVLKPTEIDLVPGISVFIDSNFTQYGGDNNYFVDKEISPGVIDPRKSRYKNYLTQVAGEVASLEAVDGVVLANACWYFAQPDDFEHEFVKEYIADIATHIKNSGDVSVSKDTPAWPDDASDFTFLRSGTDIDPLDEVILLVSTQSFKKEENIVKYLRGYLADGGTTTPSTKSETPGSGSPTPADENPLVTAVPTENLTLGFGVSDEWTFPPRFYRHLSGFAKELGLGGATFMTPVSTAGQWGPAFSSSQLQKLATK